MGDDKPTTSPGKISGGGATKALSKLNSLNSHVIEVNFFTFKKFCIIIIAFSYRLHLMTETRRIFRTVFFDEESNTFCQCSGSFWKTCPMRAANDLPCRESVVSITPVDRSGPGEGDAILGSVDQRLKGITNKLKVLSKKGFLK